MMPLKIDFDLSTKQIEFLKSTSRHTLFVSGIGGGKSFILCLKAIIETMKGRSCCIVSYTYIMLKDVLIPLIEEIMTKLKCSYTINQADMVVTINGHKLILRSADNCDRLRGLNLDCFFIDEASYCKKEVFDVLIGRIRKSSNGQGFICTTPKGYDWIYDLSKRPNINFIHQTTMENPFIPQSYIDDLIANYTSKFAIQELEGAFIQLTGGIIESDNFIAKNDLIVNKKRCCIGIDIAVSEKKSADYSAIALCSLDSMNNFQIHDIEKHKLEYPKLRLKIIEFAQKYAGVQIAVEDVAQQRIVIDDLKRDTKLLNRAVLGIRPRGDKVARAMPWVARSEQGMVYVHRDTWNKDFFDECNAFTVNDQHNHDDQIDAVSICYNHLSNEKKIRSTKVNWL